LGWQTKGIELLPVGIYAIQSRLVANKINPEELNIIVAELRQINFADYYDQAMHSTTLQLLAGHSHQ
jgi:hypothetical protein